MTNTNLTEQISQQVVDLTYQDLTPEVIEFAKMCLLDNLGCAFSGVNEPLSKILGEELLGEQTSVLDLLPSKDQPLRAPDWAMRYAATAHALDYDDTYVPGMASHTGNVVTGAILATLQQQDATGEEVITAVVAAYETAARIGELLQPEHYLNGFHTTGTIGGFTAAIAAAKLMNFDARQVAMAMGIAGTQASGLKCVFGTMTKPLNAGKAAANGILAAALVKRGYTAPTNVLEADKGFLDMYLGKPKSEWQVAPFTEFKILGNLFKFYAACHATHPVIESIKQLLSENKISGEDIANMSINVAELSLRTASVVQPKTGLECKFSIGQIAAFVLCGVDPADNQSYSDSILDNEAVNKARESITVSEEADRQVFNIGLTVTLNSGETLTLDYQGEEFFSRVRPEQLPLLNNKFVANAKDALGEHQAISLMESIMNLPESTSAFNSFSLTPEAIRSAV